MTRKLLPFFTMLIVTLSVVALLGACSRDTEIVSTQPTAIPTVAPSTATPLPVPTATPVPLPTATATEEPTATPAPSLFQLNLAGLSGVFPPIGEILPTAVPSDGANVLSFQELGIGDVGLYTNVAFGYQVPYRTDWFTGFGNRPVLVSFSNLDPGSTNRDGIRSAGCLIEISASSNTYDFSLAALQAQSPQTYQDAQETELGGVPAVLIVRQNPEQGFKSELMQVIAHGRLFVLALDFAQDREAECRPVWDEIRANWRWFNADLVPYKNSTFGYSISHPRGWFEFNSTEQGVYISSVDPTGVGSVADLVRQGMVVHTHTFENPTLLPLKEFLVSNIGDLGLTNDVDLGSILGVRSIKEGPDGSQAMTGYFQGPLGRIYVVEIFYPANRIQEFLPIANAIIYSYEF